MSDSPRSAFLVDCLSRKDGDVPNKSGEKRN